MTEHTSIDHLFICYLRRTAIGKPTRAMENRPRLLKEAEACSRSDILSRLKAKARLLIIINSRSTHIRSTVAHLRYTVASTVMETHSDESQRGGYNRMLEIIKIGHFEEKENVLFGDLFAKCSTQQRQDVLLFMGACLINRYVAGKKEEEFIETAKSLWGRALSIDVQRRNNIPNGNIKMKHFNKIIHRSEDLKSSSVEDMLMNALNVQNRLGFASEGHCLIILLFAYANSIESRSPKIIFQIFIYVLRFEREEGSHYVICESNEEYYLNELLSAIEKLSLNQPVCRMIKDLLLEVKTKVNKYISNRWDCDVEEENHAGIFRKLIEIMTFARNHRFQCSKHKCNDSLTKQCVKIVNHSPQLTNNDGLSFLQHECLFKKAESIQMLLECGADPNEELCSLVSVTPSFAINQSIHFVSRPLHLAAMDTFSESVLRVERVLDLLLQHGADPKALNGSNCTFVDVLESSENTKHLADKYRHLVADIQGPVSGRRSPCSATWFSQRSLR